MITEEKLKVLDLYNEALALYKQKRWQDAMAVFQMALLVDPDDGPSKLYIERCTEYIRQPPDADWDGVFVMKTK